MHSLSLSPSFGVYLTHLLFLLFLLFLFLCVIIMEVKSVLTQWDNVDEGTIIANKLVGKFHFFFFNV